MAVTEAGLSTLGITFGYAVGSTKPASFTQLERIVSIGEASVENETIDVSCLEDMVSKFVRGRGTVTDTLPVVVNFTEDDTSNTKAKFPTVYMFFDWVSRQDTLDGGAINAVYMTCRTKVSVTKAQGNNVAREVNAKVRDELGALGFIASGGNLPLQSGDVKEMVSNYQRVVGYDDPLTI